MSQRTRVNRSSGWSFVCVAGLLAALAGSANGQAIQWKNSAGVQLQELNVENAGDALRTLASRPNEKRAVLQFAQPLNADQRAALAAEGITILRPVSGSAYFATLNSAPDMQKLSAIAELTGASAVETSWKTHAALAGDVSAAPAWSKVRDAEATGVPGDKIVGVYVLFHKDADLNDGAALVEGLGGEVRDWLLSINGLVVELPFSRVRDLAGADSVQWVEPPLPILSELNAENRVATQVNTVQAAPYNLNGAGVRVMVYDGGTARASHQDFGGRLTVRDSASLINHATHVSGTVGGSGAASGGNNRGMAPGVTIESYGLQNTSGGIFLYTNPGDLEQDYNQAINTFNVDISNNSIGTNTAPNGFPCEIEGDYGITDVLIDSIAGGSLGEPFRIVWAAGNERQGSARCGATYRTTAPPSNNKNSIVVGAINSDTLGVTSFSSWGPSDDGRLKPDIAAPGCQAGGDGGVTSTSSGGDASYSVLCGTSMASPTVCGIGALVIQDYRAQFPTRPDLLPSTLKALLIHGALDLGNPGPDYQYGYGNVQTQNTIDFMRTGNFFEGAVDQGGATVAFITAAAGQSLKITLAWDDAPGVPNVIPSLVNDLDLVVTAPGGTRHFPWTLDPANPANNAVRTVEDHLNNVEQVVVDFAVAGVYRIEIRGTSVPEGPQRFSLVAGPSLSAFSLSLATPVPSRIDPGAPLVLETQVTALNQSLVAGSATMSYRLNPASSFTTINMTSLGGGRFRGTLPGAACGDQPQFYFSAAGSLSGPTTSPAGAPSNTYTTAVESLVVLGSDDAESGSAGWQLGVPGDTATTGQWVLVDPVGTSAQPEDDHTPGAGVNCYVTGQGAVGGAAGAADVDGGTTTLVSKVFDLSGVADATFSYWRWFSNSAGGGANEDIFTVDISNNGGASWTNVEVVGPTGAGTSGGWIEKTFQVASLVTPTANVRLRFIAADLNTGSLIEAAVDDLRISAITCLQPPACPGDANGDGQVNLADIAVVTNNWAASVPAGTLGDLSGNGSVGLEDLAIIINNWAAVCN